MIDDLDLGRAAAARVRAAGGSAFAAASAAIAATFGPAQRYLLGRDGYSGTVDEQCVIAIKPQCRGVAYDCYDWNDGARTMKVAHHYIQRNWATLKDGDVIDVQFVLGETTSPKQSERLLVP